NKSSEIMWPSPEFARFCTRASPNSKSNLSKCVTRSGPRSLRSATLRGFGAFGARGGDEVADLDVAFMAGVFVDAEIVVAHPVEPGAPRRGEHDGVFPGELVDDRVRPGHREPLGQPGLLAYRGVVLRRGAGRADVGCRRAGLEVGGNDHQRVAVFPVAWVFAYQVMDRAVDPAGPVRREHACFGH